MVHNTPLEFHLILENSSVYFFHFSTIKNGYSENDENQN